MILEIVSPEATLFKGEVTSVAVPGINGEFQMLNNHAPIVSLLAGGAICSGDSYTLVANGATCVDKYRRCGRPICARGAQNALRRNP